MDKNFGFLQYERQDDPIVPAKERLESFKEFHRPLDVEPDGNRRQDACTAVFLSASLRSN